MVKNFRTLRTLTVATLLAGFALAMTTSAYARTEDQILTGPDQTDHDRFGEDVAVDGDTAIVSNASRRSQAHVFKRDPATGNWILDDILNVLSHTVAISGNRAILGNAWAESGGTGRGEVYLFERDPVTDIWSQVATLTASDQADGDHFGMSIDISDDTIIVGAPYAVPGGTFRGKAYIFERDPVTGNWNEVAILPATTQVDGEYFGESVAIDGNTAIVGQWGQLYMSLPPGTVYIFERDPVTGNWNESATANPSDEENGITFGISVAIDGDTLIAGAYGIDGWWNQAYVFERNPVTGSWSETAILTASDAGDLDGFGRSVAIWGDTVIVGSLSAGSGEIEYGQAYIFERDNGGIDNWGESDILTASDQDDGDRFGWSVAISGDTALVGAPYADSGGTEYGHGQAYVFDLLPSLRVAGAGTGGGTMVDTTPGGTINCISAGSVLSGDCTETAPGTIFAIVATPDAGSEFTGWAGCESTSGADGEICHITLNTSTIVTATFNLYPTLTVTGAGTGNGTMTDTTPGGTISCTSMAGAMSGDCIETAPPGTVFSIVATPEAGSEFAGWAGCDSTSGTDGEVCHLTLNISTTVTATFNLYPTLTVSGAGTDSGTMIDTTPGGTISCTSMAGVMSGDCIETAPPGMVFSIVATPEAGSEFAGWAGCDSTSTTAALDDTCNLTLDVSRSVTATFNLPAFELITNGEMEDNLDGDSFPDAWTVVTNGGDKRKCNKYDPDKVFAHSGECAFMFKGDTNPYSDKIKQVIAYSGSAGDNLDLSVWAWGKYITALSGAKTVIAIKNNTTLEKEKIKLYFSHGAYAYTQFTATHVVGSANALLTTYDEIKVQVKFNGGIGSKLYVDDVSLIVTPATP